MFSAHVCATGSMPPLIVWDLYPSIHPETMLPEESDRDSLLDCIEDNEEEASVVLLRGDEREDEEDEQERQMTDNNSISTTRGDIAEGNVAEMNNNDHDHDGNLNDTTDDFQDQPSIVNDMDSPSNSWLWQTVAPRLWRDRIRRFRDTLSTSLPSSSSSSSSLSRRRIALLAATSAGLLSLILWRMAYKKYRRSLLSSSSSPPSSFRRCGWCTARNASQQHCPYSQFESIAWVMMVLPLSRIRSAVLERRAGLFQDFVAPQQISLHAMNDSFRSKGQRMVKGATSRYSEESTPEREIVSVLMTFMLNQDLLLDCTSDMSNLVKKSTAFTPEKVIRGLDRIRLTPFIVG